MNFLSIRFLALIFVTILFTKLSKTAKQQNIVIIVANVIFYLSWSFKFLILLLFESIFVFLFSKGITKSENKKIKKYYVTAGIVTVLSVLIIFKYYNFFVYNLVAFGIATNGLNIIAPVGISFYSFTMISFIVDTYKGNINTEMNIIEFLEYSLFFPTIVSGPINKAKTLIPQFSEYRQVGGYELQNSMCRFTIGAFKKVVIADRLSVYVDSVFKTPQAYSWITLIFASLGYSMQLYFDFSGYSDMAIAVANTLGIKVNENFMLPYLSKNPTEFWKRWHISLSSWLQEYLYIPLGGNRKGKIRTYINLVITMLLGGLWHGANWTFVLWGFIHGLALVIHKMFMKFRSRSEHKIAVSNNLINIICIVVNCIFVSFCWVIFRADSIGDAFIIFSRILTLSNGINYIFTYCIVFLIGIISFQIFVYSNEDILEKIYKLNLNRFSNKVIFCGMILIILAIGYYGDTAFIYGKF